MAQCSRCARFTMKAQSTPHRALGLYRCPVGPVWVFRSATKAHDCKKFAEVSPEDLPARLAFEEKEKQ